MLILAEDGLSGEIVAGERRCRVDGLPGGAVGQTDRGTAEYGLVGWTREEFVWNRDGDQATVLDLRTCATRPLELPAPPAGAVRAQLRFLPAPGGWQVVDQVVSDHGGAGDGTRMTRVHQLSAG